MRAGCCRSLCESGVASPTWASPWCACSCGGLVERFVPQGCRPAFMRCFACGETDGRARGTPLAVALAATVRRIPWRGIRGSPGRYRHTNLNYFVPMMIFYIRSAQNYGYGDLCTHDSGRRVGKALHDYRYSRARSAHAKIIIANSYSYRRGGTDTESQRRAGSARARRRGRRRGAARHRTLDQLPTATPHERRSRDKAVHTRDVKSTHARAPHQFERYIHTDGSAGLCSTARRPAVRKAQVPSQASAACIQRPRRAARVNKTAVPAASNVRPPRLAAGESELGERSRGVGFVGVAQPSVAEAACSATETGSHAEEVGSKLGSCPLCRSVVVSSASSR